MTAALGFDFTVVGAGPAGSAAALSLARLGARVLLLESRPGPTWKVGETLPPAARPLLARLGILEAFEADGHLPSYGNQSSWGFAGVAATDFIFDPNGNGWQLDRESFDSRLAEAAKQAGAELWYESRITRLTQRTDSRWQFEVTGGPRPCAVVSEWLVDASGRRCAVARRLGARRRSFDALVCLYSIAEIQATGYPEDHDSRTFVEAERDGWWYTALVPGGRRTIAWLTDLDLLRGYSWRDPWWFRSHLQTTGHVSAILERHGYGFTKPACCTSACSQRLDPCCGRSWVAVGDAAMAFDPLSSQGLFNALSTGVFAADTLAKRSGRGDTALEDYAASLETTWASYLRNRISYYRAERRWAGDVFWRRRQKE